MNVELHVAMQSKASWGEVRGGEGKGPVSREIFGHNWSKILPVTHNISELMSCVFNYHDFKFGLKHWNSSIWRLYSWISCGVHGHTSSIE
jgi:hypothetical protein